jgi:multidrug transporter EmrE-like cation transporter
MTLGIWAVALSSISLSAFAQLLMKIGMSANPAENSILAVATNPYVAGGFAAYGIGAVLWLKVLSRVELSLAYPLVSLAFVLVAVLSWLVLGERLSASRIMGIGLIVIGVALLDALSAWRYAETRFVSQTYDYNPDSDFTFARFGTVRKSKLLPKSFDFIRECKHPMVSIYTPYQNNLISVIAC